MKIVEETQNERSHQLTNFEMKFKEEDARDEEEALEKISAILANLTSKRTVMVLEASRNMQDASVQQSKRLQLEMLNMQQVSKDATKEVNEYVENANSQFLCGDSKETEKYCHFSVLRMTTKY